MVYRRGEGECSGLRKAARTGFSSQISVLCKSLNATRGRWRTAIDRRDPGHAHGPIATERVLILLQQRHVNLHVAGVTVAHRCLYSSLSLGRGPGPGRTRLNSFTLCGSTARTRARGIRTPSQPSPPAPINYGGVWSRRDRSTKITLDTCTRGNYIRC